MNCFCRNVSLIIVSGFIINSCTKSTKNYIGNTIPPVVPIVFIAGDNGTNPILWKDGTPDTLSQTSGTAYQVSLSESNLYITGVYQENRIYASPGILAGPVTGQYVYWKNGSQNNIGSFGNVDFPASIAFSGTDVYFANTYGAWKNGTALFLQGIGSDSSFSPGYVRSTFSSASDIYFAGIDSNGNAVYWKNGTVSIVSAFNRSSSNDNPIVSCLYFSGFDVYVGGMLHSGVYWKNGTPTFIPHLPDGSFVSNINSIYVWDNHVYSTGVTVSGNAPGAAYWKDTVEQVLQVNEPPDMVTSYTTTSVFVTGEDVYVTGYSTTRSSPSAQAIDSALYWKNGVEIPLKSAGRAYSILVL